MWCKKILIINTTFDRGGAAQVARDLFLKFKNLDNTSFHFAYGRGGIRQEEKTFYFGNKIEFFIHLFFVRFLGLEGFGSYFSTLKLINYIEKEKFDLIHIHNLHGYYLNFFKLLKYLNKRNIKIIWTLHDEWAFTWLPAHSTGCQHCKNLNGRCTNGYKYPKNYFPIFSRWMLKKKREILFYENIDFVCPAQWLYDEAVNDFHLKNVHLISNGVDVDLFKLSEDKVYLKNKYNLPLDKKLILFVVNNFRDKNKGGDFFLKLAELLKNEPIVFEVVGRSNFSSKNNIIKFGYISNKVSLAEIYSLSDLYCFLSSVEVTVPLTVLGAMSCGLPIFGFDNKVLNNLVYGNGQLVEYGDVNTLASAITSCFKKDQLLLNYSQHSREIILEKFDQQKNYLLYKDLYISK